MSIKTNFTVEGMTCGHCEVSVKEEVSEVAGVTDVQVNRDDKLVTVTASDDVDLQAIISAIDEAGYSARHLDS